MKKSKRSVLRFLLLDTLVLIACFALSSVLLRGAGLMFRKRVIILFLVLTFAGIFAGVVQLLFRIRNKPLRACLIGGFTVLAFAAGVRSAPVVLFALAGEEHVVERDGRRYVAHVDAFLDTAVSYHAYRGPFVEGAATLIKEYYDEAGNLISSQSLRE